MLKPAPERLGWLEGKIAEAMSQGGTIKKYQELNDEWFLIRDEIVQLLKEDLPQEVRIMFEPLGYSERVFMLCDGINYMRAQEQKNKDKATK